MSRRQQPSLSLPPNQSRQHQQAPSLSRSRSKARVFVNDDELLRTYKLSSLSPQRWEVFKDGEQEEDEDAVDGLIGGVPVTPAAGKGDEPDALGLRRGGTLEFVLLNGGVCAKLGRALRDVPTGVRSRILLHSKTFDPAFYLATVHPNATFNDLSMGREHLRENLEQRSEALKVLVEEDFDRFVGVKAATESVFDEMKMGPLSDGSDYGVKELKDSLKEASTKADQVYTPILDAAQKGSRLRSTLTVFERNKFFFSLPGILLEAIEAGRYDNALLAYKKGQYMLNGRANELLGLGSTAEASALQNEQAKRIYDKIWTQVDKIMANLKVALERKLRDGRTPVDEIERTIETLLELDPTKDPAWVYLEAQHRRVLERLQASSQSAADCYTIAVAEPSEPVYDDASSAIDIKRCILVLEKSEAEAVLENAVGCRSWQALDKFVKSILESTLLLVPGFWKLAKAYMDGKYQKRGNKNTNRQNPANCASMTNELVLSFVKTAYDFFELANTGENEEGSLPRYVPVEANTLTSATYLLKILGEFSECANELGALSLPPEAIGHLKELLSAARLKFTNILCALWIRDAKIIYRIESWQPNPDVPSTTIYLRHADTFHRHVARRAYKLAGGSEDRAPQIFSAQQVYPVNRAGDVPLPAATVQTIQSAYLDALYAFLDGLVHVAFSSPQESSLEVASPIINADESGRSYSTSDVDTRIMLTVSNLAYLQQTSINVMVGQFEAAFRVSMAEEKKTLNDVVTQLDKILFDDFLRRKTEVISAIIQVHSYMYEALLQLVLIHAQTTAVARAFVTRTMQALVHEITLEALACLSEVQQFGMGGMLQATLEIEFLHRTISQYVTPETEAKLQEVYTIISKSYYRQPNGADNAAELQHELAELKKTLVASCRASVVQFLCFRGPKVSKDKDRRHSGQTSTE